MNGEREKMLGETHETHDGKTFACKFCDRTFNVLVNMKRHTKNVHNKESTQLSLSMKKLSEEGEDEPWKRRAASGTWRDRIVGDSLDLF